MKRLFFQTRLFLLITIICSTAVLGTAQRKGFSAATPELLSDPSKIKCKAAGTWWVADVVPTGFMFSSPEEAQGIADEVIKAGGYSARSVVVKQAYVGNAAACTSDNGFYYILYDPRWFKKLYADTEEKWADRGIFAHELGHFYYKHADSFTGSNPVIELEADEYAGEILAKLGANLGQAQAAFRSSRMQAGAHGNHPLTEQRLKAVEKGWRKVSSNANLQTAAAYIDKGIALRESSQSGLAIAEFNKAIEIMPQNAVAYYNRGLAYWNNSSRYLTEAIADYTKALEIDPNYSDALIARGRAYHFRAQGYSSTVRNMADADQAIADYTRAISISSGSVRAYYLRGRVYKRAKNDYDRTLAEYSKVTELDPKLTYPYVERAEIYYFYKKDNNKALLEVNKAIAIDPKYKDAYRVRSSIYRAMGRNDLALIDENKYRGQ